MERPLLLAAVVALRVGLGGCVGSRDLCGLDLLRLVRSALGRVEDIQSVFYGKRVSGEKAKGQSGLG